MEHYKNLNLDNISEIFEGVLYTEEWEDIIWYEELYQISTFGRVKTYGNRYNGHKCVIMSLRLDKDGYVVVNLYKDGMKTVKVHRLVGITYIDNPENKAQVNHKKGVKYDNRKHQLEWATDVDNKIHNRDVLGYRSKNLPVLVGVDNPKSKPVRCTTLGIDFGSMRQASIALGFSSDRIADIINGISLQYNGLHFTSINK